jgi:hypothetical protein
MTDGFRLVYLNKNRSKRVLSGLELPVDSDGFKMQINSLWKEQSKPR